MIDCQDIIRYYEYFYKKKYQKTEDYKYIPSLKAEIEISNFICALDDKYKTVTLGSFFLNSYFIFQFQRVDEIVLERYSTKKNGKVEKGGIAQIYDIINKQALQRWFRRNIAFDFLILQSPILTKYNIRLLDLNNKPKEVNDLTIVDELERKRFLNTDRGILNCVERTSLFHPRSVNCLFCNSKKDCQLIQQKKYPYIYKSRVAIL